MEVTEYQLVKTARCVMDTVAGWVDIVFGRAHHVQPTVQLAGNPGATIATDFLMRERDGTRLRLVARILVVISYLFIQPRKISLWLTLWVGLMIFGWEAMIL